MQPGGYGHPKETIFVKHTRLFFVTVAAFLLCPSLGSAEDDSERRGHWHVDCASGETVTRLLPRIHPGDTVTISGACRENLVIGSSVGRFNGVTLEGEETASIYGSDASRNTIELTGVSSF